MFGVITVLEPVLRGPGVHVRPLLREAGVRARGCSLPLQRAMTDFGADHAFGQVPKKLQEHYGITIGTSTVRKITQGHGVQMRAHQKAVAWPVSTPGCEHQIGELDGSMVPIVTSKVEAGDKRKHKTLHWQEARLALVHAQGSVTPKFAATFGGSVEESGQAYAHVRWQQDLARTPSYTEWETERGGLRSNSRPRSVHKRAIWSIFITCVIIWWQRLPPVPLLLPTPGWKRRNNT